MRALTLWQPWASLVIAGVKPYEFRRWPAPRSLVGERIVIHAARRPLDSAEIAELLHDAALLYASIEGTAAQLAAARGLLAAMEKDPRTAPVGVGLGTVVLGKPVRAVEMIGPQRDGYEIDPDCWAWPVTDAQPWPAPIPCRGRQGFWPWPEVAADGARLL